MAIYLITGTPGAGKTLNTIKEVWDRSFNEQRLVFYYGISLNKTNSSNIDFSFWREMESVDSADMALDVTPFSWFNAPKGSIILIDEAQNFFPSVGSNAVSKAPDYIKRFATHRHDGYDIYLITQAPSLIHASIKDWVQPHVHYRRIWGGNVTWKYVNEYCVNNIRDVRSISSSAIKSRVKLNKHWFSVYESAVFHTDNKRIPKKIIFIMLFSVTVLISSFYYLASYFSQNSSQNLDQDEKNQLSDSDKVKIENPISGSGVKSNVNSVGLGISSGRGFGVSDSNNSLASKKFDPIVEYAPRIEAMPETAPAYDDLRRPKDFPRPQCLLMSGSCKCYTQQATLMVDYPRSLCLSHVRNGYFDPTVPRVSSSGNGSVRTNVNEIKGENIKEPPK